METVTLIIEAKSADGRKAAGLALTVERSAVESFLRQRTELVPNEPIEVRVELT